MGTLFALRPVVHIASLILVVCSVVCAVTASAQDVSAATGGGSGGTVYSPSHSVASKAPDTMQRAVEVADTRGPAWYGWQTLLSDVLGVGLLVLSAETGHSDGPGLLGAGFLLLGAPAIHAVHQNWTGCGVSLGLRLGAGLAILGGIATVMGDGSAWVAASLVLGGGIVGAVAVLLDLMYFGFAQVPARRPGAYALTPWADPRGSAGLQLMASF